MPLAAPPPSRLKGSEDIEFYKSLTSKGHYKLDSGERKWRDRAAFLETQGYILRPRFRKNWEPSWLGTSLHPDDCEDSFRLIVSAS